MLMSLVPLALAAAAAQGAPAPSPPAAEDKQEVWLADSENVLHALAPIAFPAEPAGMPVTETKDFSRPGEGLDTALLYASADKSVWARAYVFMPGVAHGGLAAIATDGSIRSTSKGSASDGAIRRAAASGRDNVALRADYQNYLGDKQAAPPS